MTQLVATAPVQSPTSAREARTDRFLARVATLSPRQWGELDAIGQRFEGADPIAWWERARRISAFASKVPVLEDVMRGVTFVAMGVGDLVQSLGGRRAPRYPRPVVSHGSPEARQIGERLETLWDVASSQPGGAGPSIQCLALALLALWMRDYLTADGFAELYGLVEPVIPAASV
jgi:hypothetical protein